jgi:hypothetical protein
MEGRTLRRSSELFLKQGMPIEQKHWRMLIQQKCTSGYYVTTEAYILLSNKNEGNVWSVVSFQSWFSSR